MARALYLAHAVPTLLLMLLLSTGKAAAQEEPKDGVAEPEQAAAEGAVYGDERVVEALEEKGGRLGYSFVSVDGYGGRAMPYGFLHSSPSGALYYRTLEKDGTFDLEGNFLNEHDYHGDLVIDYKGDYRFHLRTESLFHNLDRETLFSPNFNSGRADVLGAAASFNAFQDPPANYGVSSTQDLATFRYRLHNYPLHVNLGYWRLVKDGTVQQRFADVAFEGPVNNIFAVPRRLRHQTQEGSVGFDAHLGWVDIIYDFRVRVFQDQQPIPTASYEPRFTTLRTPETVGGVQQHNEDPDSRYLSHTIKAHTSLTGGLVASASYSLGQRENLSRLTDVSGVKHSEVNLQNVAGDLVYTPCKPFSAAIKYRRQELENEGRGTVTDVNYVDPVQQAKTPVNSTKDIAILTLAYKPWRELTMTGEYRGEYLNRGYVSAVPTATSFGLPETAATQKGSLALLYHPARGVRASAKYSYETTDHPSYGTSFEQKHQGELLATYTGKSWGVTANVSNRREWNDNVEHYFAAFTIINPEPGTSLLSFSGFTPSPRLSRERTTENANVAFWIAPVERLTLSANYAFLSNRVDQGVLFTGTVVTQPNAGSQAVANFDSHAHVYGVTASYQATEKLDLSLMLQQIRSDSAFTPETAVFSVDNNGVSTADTSGIRDITRQDTVISLLSARSEYRFTRQLTGSLEYTLQDYNEKNPVLSAQNGTVHAVVAYVTAKW